VQLANVTRHDRIRLLSDRQFFLRCVAIGERLGVESRPTSGAPDIVDRQHCTFGQPNQLRALAVGTSRLGGVEQYGHGKTAIAKCNERTATAPL